MQLKKSLLLTILVTITLLPACKKYEEGPGISFRSRKERVANTWVIDKYYMYGEDYTDWYKQIESGYTLTLEKDGKAKSTSTYMLINPPVTTTRTGTWELTDNDEKLKISLSYDGGQPQVSIYTVFKLKENELWVKDLNDANDDTDDYEFHYKPQ